jgi:hypothetical protein
MGIRPSRRPRRAAAVIAVAAALAVATAVPTSGVAASAAPGACAGLTALVLANTTIDSAVDTPKGTVGVPPAPVVRTCRVHASVNTPGTNDHIGIDVWMPVSGWNGRFQGIGGGGYIAGDPSSLARPVNAGFAGAVTDAGHMSANPLDGSFALDGNGRLNWPLIQDFAYRAVHDLAVVGKAVTAAYYGSSARASYWNGCSTGGRQALAEAQRYPTDFDGILAGAPAINWQRYVPASLWPQLVMQRSGDFLPTCKFSAFQNAAIQACDTVGDQVADGVIGDPLACDFDPASLIGTSTPCGTITAQDADVVARIIAGPRTTSGDFLWYGLTWGAPLAGDFPGAGLANTTLVGGTLVGAPFPLVLQHLGTWTQQNPPVPAGTWDWTSTSYDQFDQLFQQSVELYGSTMGTDDPDLRAFRNAGGKLVIYHGLADQLIFPQGTINYYHRVQQATGGHAADFARVFLVPGMFHCAGGPGPQPDKPMNKLISWVEGGTAPNTLNGTIRDPATNAIIATRRICMYPNVAVYKGHGPTTDAASFVCRPSGE